MLAELRSKVQKRTLRMVFRIFLERYLGCSGNHEVPVSKQINPRVQYCYRSTVVHVSLHPLRGVNVIRFELKATATGEVVSSFAVSAISVCNTLMTNDQVMNQ
ncbi:hypothetical protein EVAR_67447_1 [Eumeta japonica]|uniref:Uncharacterized protein n=1 Tax=Eumeta variegata TaxID=151549 RepID=A0A4C2A237_EUMVA|nr:hypothetical protein EVAR_67447_1 [Eumeta japonica]